jgi:hypothetical protein
VFKKAKTIVTTLTVLSIVLGGSLTVSHAAIAAACSNASNYGVATMTVSVPAAGDYRIWSRMKVPSTAASTYQLEADGNTCWQVGGSNVAVNVWTWVDWTGSNNAQKVNYTFTAGNHTLKLIGTSVNVQVDKVILLGTGEQCSDSSTSPTGDGSNCATGPAATSTSSGSQGSTTPSVVVANQANVAQTSYVVDGKVVQSSTGATALDTSKLPDGTYNVQTIVKLKDGTEVTANETITVKNKKSFIAKHKVLILIGAVVLLLVCVAFAFWWLFYRGHGAVLVDKVKSMFGKNIPISDAPSSTYVDPQVIQPSDKD